MAVTRAAFVACVFSILALSGPGRIDIVDGQTRYEVARSLVDHGDVAVRNRDAWFGVFPGRDGLPHSYYRFPQSVFGVPFIVAADATGVRSEARRHFFFSLTSAAAGALLGLSFLIWFRRQGLAPAEALRWAVAGVFCTPAWFYSTSTFDDILGSAAVVAAIVSADASRHQPRIRSAIASGLLLGLAFNCKQPLAAFGLAVLAAADTTSAPIRQRLTRAATIAAGLFIGIAVYVAYDVYKFPPGTKEAHGALLAQYIPNWPGHFWTALLVLALSPGAGVLWYSPSAILSIHGLRHRSGSDRRLALAVILGLAVFTAFIASLTVFKGDPAWGPRYFTPVFAVLWLFAAKGAALLKRQVVTLVLVVGLLVQLLALTVDPHRLYVEHRLPSAFGADVPMLYFYPPLAHLLQRPREIAEVAAAAGEPGERFTPAPHATFAFPVINQLMNDPGAVERYKLLNSFRPWWASHWYIAVPDRPVPIVTAIIVLLALGAASAAVLWRARWRESDT